MDTQHSLVDARSLALHAAVAEGLRRDPSGIARARSRVDGWAREGSVARPYVEGWRGLLDGPMEDLLAVLADRGERATALRQVSPFAGALSPRERWAILRGVGARVSAPAGAASGAAPVPSPAAP